MTATAVPEFGLLRSVFWPIHRHEGRMIIPLFLILFFICFNYTVVRNMKDSLIITAEGSSAAVIPYIKVWLLLPMALLLTAIFTKASSRFSQEQVVYILISGFLVFYLIFLVWLYPNRDVLQPTETAKWLENALPTGFQGAISMYRHWTFALFYVLSELWGSIVLTVLFWGFANEVTRIGDAKRFYAVLCVGGNLAAVLGGQVPQSLLYFIPTESELFVYITIGIVILNGIIIMGIFRWLNCYVFNNPRFDALHTATFASRKQKKLSLRDCFVQLARSKYLLCIALLVVGYNLGINVIEVVWKDQVHELYPEKEVFNAYIGNVTSLHGLLAIALTGLIPVMIRKLGWTKTALITPVAMLITGIAFFALLLSKAVVPVDGMTLLTGVVLVGAIQNAISKACKYSLFDTTKEMAFIPLDHYDKLRGKAVIDGVGSRLGKSGGSLLQQGLLLMFGSLAASVPCIGVILFLVIGAWIMATRSLGRKLHILVNQRGEEIGEDNEEKEVVLATATELSTDHKAAPVAS